jgi:hypothetical protein
MAGIFIYSFDWKSFDGTLGPPAIEPARRIAAHILKCRKRSQDDYSGFPEGEKELIAFIAGRFEAEDWYGGKAHGDMNLMDTLVHMLFFEPKIQKRSLKVKVLGDSVAGLMVLGLAQGDIEVDASGTGSRRSGTRFRRGHERWGNLAELPSLGCRPHRHARWDRKAASEAIGVLWERLAAGQPTSPVYWPLYSIHSPEQVVLLFEELSIVHESVRPYLDRDPDLRDEFEAGLLRPIEAAVKGKQAVYASVDT